MAFVCQKIKGLLTYLLIWLNGYWYCHSSCLQCPLFAQRHEDAHTNHLL